MCRRGRKDDINRTIIRETSECDAARAPVNRRVMFMEPIEANKNVGFASIGDGENLSMVVDLEAEINDKANGASAIANPSSA